MGQFGLNLFSMTFFYKDFGKLTNDLITKDLPTNEQLKVNGKYKQVKLAFTGKTSGNRAEGVFEPSYCYPDYGLELKGSAKSDGEISATASVADKWVNGLNAGITFKSGKNQQLEATADYKHKDVFAVSSKFVFPANDSKSSADLSTAFFKNNWAFGGSLLTKFDESMSSPEKLSVGFQYTSGLYTATTLVTREKSQVSSEFRYFRAHNTSAVGTLIKANHATGSSSAALAVTKLCDCGGVGKLVISTNSSVALSWKKAVGANTTLTVSAQGNTATKEYQLGLHVDLVV